MPSHHSRMRVHQLRMGCGERSGFCDPRGDEGTLVAPWWGMRSHLHPQRSAAQLSSGLLFHGHGAHAALQGLWGAKGCVGQTPTMATVSFLATHHPSAPMGWVLTPRSQLLQSTPGGHGASSTRKLTSRRRFRVPACEGTRTKGMG